MFPVALVGPHQNCKLNSKFRKCQKEQKGQNEYFLFIIFHNLRGCDNHPIMKHSDKKVKRNLQCLANTMEKYISSVGGLRFIDSLQFLNASLETLVDNLNAGGTLKFINLKHVFSDEHNVMLLLRKGIYPYDFMDDELNVDLSDLPEGQEFYNILTDSHILDSEYSHAQEA